MRIIKCASQTLQEIQSETCLQLLWIKRRKLFILLTIGHKRVIPRKTVKYKYKLIVLTKCFTKYKNVLSFCLKLLMVQADLMSTGRLFQSRGAAAMKDRSPMVTLWKVFGVLRRIPMLFRRKS